MSISQNSIGARKRRVALQFDDALCSSFASHRIPARARSRAPLPLAGVSTSSREGARLGEAKVRELRDAGGVLELPDIGEVTAEVMDQALAGSVPSYLANLEAAWAARPKSPSFALRRALRGDFTLHTDWSDGSSPLELMAETALAMGTVTSRSPIIPPVSAVARGLSPERLVAQIEQIEAHQPPVGPFPRAQRHRGRHLGRRCARSIFRFPRAARRGHWQRPFQVTDASRTHDSEVIRAIEIRTSTSSGTSPVASWWDEVAPSQRRRRAGAARLRSARQGHRNQLAPRTTRPASPDPSSGLRDGCTFAINTDAHSPGQLEWLENGSDRAFECGIGADRVVNTWYLDDLERWYVRRHAER